MIAASYHRKSATGQPGPALVAPVPFGLRSLGGLLLAKSQQQAKGVASDTSCVASDVLVRFTEALVGFKGVRLDDGWGRLIISEVRVVWLPWLVSSELLEFGGRCIPSSQICCSTAATPSFFRLGIFLFTLWRICLVWAPLLHSSCLAVIAVFMASVQYRWVSKCEEVRSVKLTSKRNRQLSGTLLGLRSESSVISCNRSSNCLLRRYPCHLSCKEMLR